MGGAPRSLQASWPGIGSGNGKRLSQTGQKVGKHTWGYPPTTSHPVCCGMHTLVLTYGENTYMHMSLTHKDTRYVESAGRDTAPRTGHSLLCSHGFPNLVPPGLIKNPIQVQGGWHAEPTVRATLREDRETVLCFAYSLDGSSETGSSAHFHVGRHCCVV